MRHTRWLHNPLIGWRRPRRLFKIILASVFAVLCLRLLSPIYNDHYQSTASPSEAYLKRGAFTAIPITGFANTGSPDPATACEELRHDGQLQVQQSFHLDDDLQEIAKSLEKHPMIDYSSQDQSLTYEEQISNTWSRLAQSSVWLPEKDVFLTITRVIFYSKGVKQWPIISFLRAQIYDEDWNELRNYTIEWQGKFIVFPTILDIPAPFKAGGCFYGPEDPRVIIEAVEDAEPVIVFNMMIDTEDVTMAMYMFRPFSNHFSVFSIVGQGSRSEAEKNWMPFFHKNTELMNREGQHEPSQYLHFIQYFEPLRILKCHLVHGWCETVHEQKSSDNFSGPDGAIRKSIITDGAGRISVQTKDRISGGTNFVPLALDATPGMHAYVGFPRSHIESGCTDGAMYRPELAILTAYGESYFHLHYMSDSIDFGSSAMDRVARSDPCGEGRILIANSIAKWDRDMKQDVMTLAFTVDDSTTQVLRLHGVWKFVQSLPHLHYALENDSLDSGDSRERWSGVGERLLACSVEAARNYTINAAAPYNGTSLRKQRQDETMRQGLKAE